MSGLNQQFTKLSAVTSPRVRISLSPKFLERSGKHFGEKKCVCTHFGRDSNAGALFFQQKKSRGDAQTKIFDEKFLVAGESHHSRQ